MEGAVVVKVRSLQRFCDPYAHTVWHGMKTPLRISEVSEALGRGAVHGGHLEASVLTPHARERHVERVAWFVVHGWEDPITIDVDMARHDDWMIDDGNHRFAAAIYRGDETIEALVYGQVDYAERLLGITIQG